MSEEARAEVDGPDDPLGELPRRSLLSALGFGTLGTGTASGRPSSTTSIQEFALPYAAHVGVFKDDGGETVAIDSKRERIAAGSPAATIEAALGHLRENYVEQASAASVGLLKIHPGRYVLEKTLDAVPVKDQKNRIAVIGDPNWSDASKSVVFDCRKLNGSRGVEIVSGREMSLYGIGFDGGGRDVDLLYIDDGSLTQMVNLRLRNTFGTGVYYEDAGNSRMHRVTLVDCGSKSNGSYGLHTVTADRSCDVDLFDCVIINSRVGGDNNTALYHEGSRLQINRCNLKTRGQAGRDVFHCGNNVTAQLLRITSTGGADEGAAINVAGTNSKFVNCSFEKMKQGVVMGGARNRFVGCEINNNNAHGVVSRNTGGGQFNEFVSCRIHSNSQADPGAFDDMHVDAPNVRVLGGFFGAGSGSSRYNVNSVSQPVIVDGGTRLTSLNGNVRIGMISTTLKIHDSGTATLPGGSTEVPVQHSLAGSLGNNWHENVQVMPTTALGRASNWWVSDPTTNDGEFTIHIDEDAGRDVTFSWQVQDSRSI